MLMRHGTRLVALKYLADTLIKCRPPARLQPSWLLRSKGVRTIDEVALFSLLPSFAQISVQCGDFLCSWNFCTKSRSLQFGAGWGDPI